MRRPLLAAVAATIALSVNPAHAAAPGAGTAVAYATGFFRPNSGIVAVGTCTYAGYTLAGTAVALGVLPGNEDSLTITCSLRNAYGSQIGSTTGSGVNEASTTSTVIGGDVATTICATLTATSRAPGVPAAYGSMCAPVLPGNVKS
jgi:hypothetical protein